MRRKAPLQTDFPFFTFGEANRSVRANIWNEIYMVALNLLLLLLSMSFNLPKGPKSDPNHIVPSNGRRRSILSPDLLLFSLERAGWVSDPE